MVISFLFLLLRKNACLLKVDRHNAKTPTLPTKVRWATALRIGIEPMTQIHHVLTCSRLTV